MSVPDSLSLRGVRGKCIQSVKKTRLNRELFSFEALKSRRTLGLFA